MVDKPTVREVLTEYAKKHEETDTSDETLLEYLEDAEVVKTGDRHEHRWYIVEDVVVKLEEHYIDRPIYLITGDNSMCDMDLSYNLDEMKVVYPKERQITEIYYTADK